MPFAANLLAGSLIVVVKLSEFGDKGSEENECLILPMERLTSNSSAIGSSSSQKSTSGSHGSSRNTGLKEKPPKPLMTKNSESRNKKLRESETNVEQASSSRLLIQQGRELPEVHQGIAASSLPIPFRKIYQNWKDVPKLHQYSPAQLQVVFHRRSGEIETKIPGSSTVENNIRDINEFTEERNDIVSSRNNSITGTVSNNFVSNVIGKPHDLKNSKIEGEKRHLDHQSIVSFPDTYFGSFKTQQCQTDAPSTILTTEKTVQTEEEKGNTSNKKIDISQSNIDLRNFHYAFKSQESQTNISNLAFDVEKTSQTEFENSMNSETQVDFQELVESELKHSSCGSCHSSKDQMQGLEDNIKRLVELLDATTDDLNEHERRVEDLIQENMQLKSAANLHVLEIKKYNATVDSIATEMEITSKSNEHSSSRICDLEQELNSLGQTLNSKDGEIKQIQEINEELQTQISRLEANRKVFESLKEQDEEKLEASVREMEVISKSNEHSSSRICDLEQELNSLGQTLNSKDREIQQIQEINEELQTQISRLETNRKVFESLKEQDEEKFEASVREMEVIAKTNEISSSRICDLEQELKSLGKTLNSKDEEIKQSKEINEELQTQKFQLEASQKVFESQLSILQKFKEQCKEELETSLREMEVIAKTNEISSSRICDLEQELKSLGKTLNSKDEEIKQSKEINEELQTYNLQLVANQKVLKTRLVSFEKLNEEDRDKLSKCEKLVKDAEAENSNLKIKMQQLQIQLDYFQNGMSRLRNAIDRPVAVNSIPTDGKVKEILMRAENVIADYPDTEITAAKINRYLTEMSETVNSINGGSQTDALSNNSNQEKNSENNNMDGNLLSVLTP